MFFCPVVANLLQIRCGAGGDGDLNVLLRHGHTWVVEGPPRHAAKRGVPGDPVLHEIVANEGGPLIGWRDGRGPRSQAVDQSQNFREEPPWDRHFGKLECDVPAMPDHFCADLDQLLAQRGQRPVLDLLR